jgi:uncharacterized membrane protein
MTGRARRRPFVKALLGGTLATRLARGPSLLPRGADDQALVEALAALAGGAAAIVVDEALYRIARGRAVAKLPLALALGTTSGVAYVLATRLRRRSPAVDALEATAAVLTFGSAVSEVELSLFDDRATREQLVMIERAIGLALATNAASRALRAKLAEPRDLVKAGIRYRRLPTVSGGAGSHLPWEALDREGRKVLGLASSAEEIARVTGTPARDPIRVYVGLDHGTTPEEKARLALAELDRLGAFERRDLLVVCPTGAGYVNPVALESCEHLSGGDLATVVVQYANRRAHRSRREIPKAMEIHRVLILRLSEMLSRRAGGPRLMAYGESLGSWVLAGLLAQEGIEAIGRYGIRSAALIGLPYDARRLLEPLLDRLDLLPGEAAQWQLREDVLDGLRTSTEPRYVLYTHPEDPVALFPGTELIWRRPDWLADRRANRGRIASTMRFYPVLTFLQVLADLKNSTSFKPDFGEHDHDYRAEVPAIFRATFGYDVDDDVLGRIGALTQASAIRQYARERGLTTDPPDDASMAPTAPTG